MRHAFRAAGLALFVIALYGNASAQTLGTIAGDKSSTIVFPLPVDLLKGLVDKQK